jgi:hypothetical protein
VTVGLFGERKRDVLLQQPGAVAQLDNDPIKAVEMLGKVAGRNS